MEFKWWYIVAAFLAIFLIFGKRKGGVVVQCFSAHLDVLDSRFESCRPDAAYKTFKEGTPDHIDIELENLSIPVGDELDFLINGQRFATVAVKRNGEAEFDHWSDEGVKFPKIGDGDEFLVRYQQRDVLKGVFRLE